MEQNGQTTQSPQTGQPNGMVQQPTFNDQHNNVYNTLRNQMMQYAAAGVPGMEDVVNALNKTHTKLMGSYTPTQSVQPRTVAAGQPTTVPQTPQQLQQVNQLMQQIRNRNSSPSPSGATAYQ